MVAAGQRILASDFEVAEFDFGGSPWVWTGTAKRQKSGKICVVSFSLVLTSASGTLFLSIPFVGDPDVKGTIGHGQLTGEDISAGERWSGKVKLESSANISLWTTEGSGTNNFWTATQPFTWAAGDTLSGSFSYLTE